MNSYNQSEAVINNPLCAFAVKQKELVVLLNLVNLALQRIPKMVREDNGSTVLIIFSQIMPLLAEERLKSV